MALADALGEGVCDGIGEGGANAVIEGVGALGGGTLPPPLHPDRGAIKREHAITASDERLSI